MMRRAWLLAGLLPAACGLVPPVDSAQLPPGEFGATDRDVAALNYAAQAFSSGASTYGRPAAGAEAVLAVDYVAGAMNTGPRWAWLSPDMKDALLQARAQVRDAVGIAPGAASQDVVDRLALVRAAVQANNEPAALAALRDGAFTKGPDATLVALGNLPYLQKANATLLQVADVTSGNAPVGGPGLPLGF